MNNQRYCLKGEVQQIKDHGVRRNKGRNKVDHFIMLIKGVVPFVTTSLLATFLEGVRYSFNRPKSYRLLINYCVFFLKS